MTTATAIDIATTKATATTIKTHAKWVLAGEHAVMRGSNAIILPLIGYDLNLHYTPNDEPFQINFDGEYGETLRVLVWGAIHEALAKINIDLNTLTGKVDIHNHIPMGAGLGFSAALCVGIGRLLMHFEYLNEIELFDFAKHLEDLFHGNSSGMDIASVIYSKPISFNHSGTIKPMELTWQPNLYLSYSQQHSLTIDCVNQVTQLIKDNPELGKKIDNDMQSAVATITLALQADAKTGLPSLVNGMQKASECFRQWGLLNKSMEQQITALNKAGALATKPTGAGNGGYIISLWENMPPKDCGIELIRAL